MGSSPKPGRRTAWIAVSVIAAIVVLAIIGEIVIGRAGSILKNRIEETLQTRFHSRVEVAGVHVSVLRGLEVSGSGLRIFPTNSVAAAGAKDPLIDIARFSFHAGIIGLFIKPMQVGQVYIGGLKISIPPREMRAAASDDQRKYKGGIKINVREIVCENSQLVIGTAKPDKDPKDFELRHLLLHDVGPDAPWKYDAVLTNAIPRGEIKATGFFGPWNAESPGDSAVKGHYTFEHADLNTIKGLGGVLSSVGNFEGQLNRIAVTGVTDTPDFSLDTSNQPLPLHTKFHATVDGTTGDTYLEHIEAKLKNSSFTTSGKVVNIKGEGHRIDLDADIPAGHLQDFLELAVRTRPPVLTAIISMKAKLLISPGKEPVPRKLGMQGNFILGAVHFTSSEVQDKVDSLSMRAQGDPKEAKPGAPDVRAKMKGRFVMSEGTLRFSQLDFAIPGANADLEGIYTLDGQTFDFQGRILTDAKISEMIAAKWKSVLLKAVDPFFKRKGGGAEIPVSVSGTKSAPKFGLDVIGKHSKER